MTTEAPETAKTKTFSLACTDCQFETAVTGTFHDALDAAQAHQEEHGVASSDHFVNFELDQRT